MIKRICSLALCAVLIFSLCACGAGQNGVFALKTEKEIFSGYHKGGHVQGIAVDTERGFVYYSFTTRLVKTDSDGKLLGSVVDLTGHLGCITFDAENNKIYGSLEYKHDDIGRGIEKATGKKIADVDAFYAVCFDCEKITEEDISAEDNDIMTAVYLADVADDYSARDTIGGYPHRYGCSGIDGTALGPVFGAAPDSEKKIMIAYGIYGESDRLGNDYQIILQYDRSIFFEYGKPLRQLEPHRSGPGSSEAKYFFHTGNTRYGIQNLEYDSYTNSYLAAVYPGKKAAFENYDMFFIDALTSPEEKELEERNGERALVLSPSSAVAKPDKNGITGIHFRYGAEGMVSLGNGEYYFSKPGFNPLKNAHTSTVCLYGADFYEQYE